MAGSTQPFRPGGTLTITSSASASVAGTLVGGGDAVLVTNSSTSLVFVRLDAASPTASAADVPVPAGGRLLLACPATVGYAAVWLASGGTAGAVYFTRGDGTSY